MLPQWIRPMDGRMTVGAFEPVDEQAEPQWSRPMAG
jgi:hypothetical protein